MLALYIVMHIHRYNHPKTPGCCIYCTNKIAQNAMPQNNPPPPRQKKQSFLLYRHLHFTLPPYPHCITTSTGSKSTALFLHTICATSSMKTPSQAESVNVITLKSGFTSAIFFNHSIHAPHGFNGLMQLRSAGTRATTRPDPAARPPPRTRPAPPHELKLSRPALLLAGEASVVAAAEAPSKESPRVAAMLLTSFVRRTTCLIHSHNNNNNAGCGARAHV